MIEKTVFGHLPSGEQVDLYTITNSRGASVSLQTLGAGIVRLYMPDRNGSLYRPGPGLPGTGGGSLGQPYSRRRL